MRLKKVISLLRIFTFILLFILYNSSLVNAQIDTQRIGFREDAKRLIMHALDQGVFHSENKYSNDAFESSATSSKSIIVPCQWFNKIIVPLDYDDAELKVVMISHPNFGSYFRQKDLNCVVSVHFKSKLKEHNINLVS